MTKKIPTNKLSIYLIRENYCEDKDILKNFDTLQSISVEDIGVLYFGKSHTFPPLWLENFFDSALDNTESKNLFSATSKAIFLTKVQVTENQERIFAIPFGYGWTFLNNGVYEERFGLKVTLNIVEPDNLRRIDKKSMSTAPKDTSEQLSKVGPATDFGIDIEQDLILSITGKTKDSERNFGKTITGKDSLTLSAKVNLSNIKDFLKLVYKKYEGDEYKTNFGWIDQIQEIKDHKITNDLNMELLNTIKSKNFEKVWMSVPELIDWTNISGFSYINNSSDLKNDIFLTEFISNLSELEQSNLNLEVFNKTISCFSSTNDELKYQWKAFNCLYCEIEDTVKEKTYLLSNGKWYEIENNFAKQINANYKQFRDLSSFVVLPPCAYVNTKENTYNKNVADNNHNFCCMDMQLIPHGGGYSKIEFCDLYSKDNKIIHVKHYGGSTVLNHLFSQGVVSGELFLSDKEFREKLNLKLPDDFKIQNTNTKPNPLDFEIVFGIISASSKPLEIPFFSKVGLRNAKRRLETYGYKVSLQKISVQSNGES